MLDRNLLTDILSHALQRGGDFAEVFVENGRSNAILCEENKIEKISSGQDIGAGIRILHGESTAYALTNDLSREGLLHAAEVASNAVQDRQPKDLTVDLTHETSSFDFEVDKPPQHIDMQEKVGIVERANHYARSHDHRIRQVVVSYGDILNEIEVANSEGQYINDSRIRTRLVVRVVAGRDDIIQTGHEARGGFVGFEIFDKEQPEDIAAEACDRALLMLDARPAPTGRMPVVMGGEAGGTMVHEACGHGLEADLVQKNISVYSGDKGEKVASELVTVIDDATMPGKYGSYRFDDEGSRAQRTVLIQEGVLKRFLNDRLTARESGEELTGNARRESYRHKPLPRMTNTYIQPGESDPEEIISNTERGLFVRKMGGGQVDTATGDFVFEVSEGYMIKNGSIREPVRGATLTGNGPQALRNIDMVGSDLGFTIGVCGKNGQGVPTSTGQPTVRIPELIIGGTEV